VRAPGRIFHSDCDRVDARDTRALILEVAADDAALATTKWKRATIETN
jgi:hypothetical protein